ncbi:recombinase family protein [Pedobacter sp. MC2016-24]|uniref:recombinase family protein n=1 Tax=Pedobacter sp. MC2016-24 TaxID=2780090 RepID=UPI00187F9395|nr:recombinase family protein [Pedobacter sp. MC2016-24]MBE9599925.1 recombinase family protein [Pedobacter sp. MC2016-24]
MKKAILYIRVSTEEQADKGYSQRNQAEALQNYCHAKSILILDLIYEDYSAKTFKRPAWTKLLTQLKKNSKSNQPDLILFTKWDRFSRNAADAYQMISILRKLQVEPQATEQPLDISIPENKLMLAIYLATPEVENDRRALNVFYGMRRAKKEGRWMASAPIGYINRTTETGRKYIRPNEPYASIIRKSFIELAKGKLAVDQVWKQARLEGLKCGRRNFAKLIRNPAYCGKIVIPELKDEAAHTVTGQHEPIISSIVFDKVQAILEKRKPAKGTTFTLPDQFFLRGFLKCPNCKRMLTASASKSSTGSHYTYYHCNSKCRIRFPALDVNEAFINLLLKLVPEPSYKSLFKEIAKDVFKQAIKSRQMIRTQTFSKLESFRLKLRKIKDSYIEQELGLKDYLELKSEVEEKISALETQMESLPDLEQSITRILNQQEKSFLNLKTLFTKSSIEDKRQIIQLIFGQQMHYIDQQFGYSLTIPAKHIFKDPVK